MKIKVILSVLALFLTAQIFAQSSDVQRSEIFELKKGKKVNVSKIEKDWSPFLQSLEMPNPGGKSYRIFLNRVKDNVLPNHEYTQKIKPTARKTDGTMDPPVLLRNFKGNTWNGSTPCDNDVAISDDGWLVSVVNTNIHIYDTNLDMLMASFSLNAFTDTSLSVDTRQFDPRALYDPKQDRFIIVYLAGGTSTTNNIVVAFSATNDPTGVWHQYAIDGNPLSNMAWSDYPIIAMTDDELFITINLIRDDSSWQAGFVESIIWQVEKNSGYSGSSLNAAYYNGVWFDGKPIRNLCPIQGGETTYGPNIYLLSNRNFDVENDTVFVIEVTGTLSDPGTTVNVDFVIMDQKYGLPPHGFQSNSQLLQTNDSRVLDGYMQDGQLHFVGNTVDMSSGRAGIFHGIIDDIGGARNTTLHILGDTALDYGYPDISYSGTYAGDNQAIINYNYSSVDSNPGMSATFYEQWAGHSERLTIKSAESFVNILSIPEERWGDYSGSQRRYNEPGKVWVNGYYGGRQMSGGINQRVNLTWIAELGSPGSTPASIEEPKEITNSNLYPNPAIERVYFEFDLPEKELIIIKLFDLEGKLVKRLYKDIGKKGPNQFSFSTQPLASGRYILNVSNAEKSIITEALIVTK